MEQIVKFAKKTRDAIKIVKQMTQPDGLLEKAVKTNFLHSLFLMANASAVTNGILLYKKLLGNIWICNKNWYSS